MAHYVQPFENTQAGKVAVVLRQKGRGAQVRIGRNGDIGPIDDVGDRTVKMIVHEFGKVGLLRKIAPETFMVISQLTDPSLEEIGIQYRAYRNELGHRRKRRPRRNLKKAGEDGARCNLESHDRLHEENARLRREISTLEQRLEAAQSRRVIRRPGLNSGDADAGAEAAAMGG